MIAYSMDEAAISQAERQRIDSLMRMLPKVRVCTILEIGARSPVISEMLAERCGTLFAMGPDQRTGKRGNIITMPGDICSEEWRNCSYQFDGVVCTEVLEHVPNAFLAAMAINRLAYHWALIGVPYHQDLRLARVWCDNCQCSLPGWGHLRRFGIRKLDSLFHPMRRVDFDLCGQRTMRTTALAARLMEIGRHPWGPYDQQEPCPNCNAVLTPPVDRPLWRRACAGIAARMNAVYSRGYSRPAWVHALYQK